MSGKKKRVVVDYYYVESKGGNHLQEVMQGVSQIPLETSRRNYSPDSFTPMRLQYFDESKDGNSGRQIIIGDMLKIRMDNLPSKASTKGGMNPIDFADDEGVGEDTAFLFSPSDSILVMQRHRYGITAKMFESYFNHFAIGDNTISLVPIVDYDTLEKLKSSSRLATFEVKLKPAISSAALAAVGGTVEHALAAMEDIDGQSVNITIASNKSQKRGLSMKAIFPMIKKLLKAENDGAGIEKIKVGAELEEHAGTNLLDLLAGRLYYEELIEYGADRRLSYNTRTRLVKSAWESKELQKALQTMAELSHE